MIPSMPFNCLTGKMGFFGVPQAGGGSTESHDIPDTAAEPSSGEFFEGRQGQDFRICAQAKMN